MNYVLPATGAGQAVAETACPDLSGSASRLRSRREIVVESVIRPRSTAGQRRDRPRGAPPYGGDDVFQQPPNTGKSLVGRRFSPFRFRLASAPFCVEAFSFGGRSRLRGNPLLLWFVEGDQPSPQLLQRQLFVSVLAPRGPARHHNPGRRVRQPNAAFHFVGVLPSRPAGAKRLHLAFGQKRIVVVRDRNVRHD